MQVDERNDGGSTPLALAAADGHLSLLARLVGLGADVNAVNKYGMSPLHRYVLVTCAYFRWGQEDAKRRL